MKYRILEECFRPRKQGTKPPGPHATKMQVPITELESVVIEALAARLGVSKTNALRYLATQGLGAMAARESALLDDIDTTPPSHGVARDLYRSRK